VLSDPLPLRLGCGCRSRRRPSSDVFEIKPAPGGYAAAGPDQPAASQLAELAERVPPIAQLLMERFWPGRLTLVLDARQHIPARLTASAP